MRIRKRERYEKEQKNIDETKAKQKEIKTREETWYARARYFLREFYLKHPLNQCKYLFLECGGESKELKDVKPCDDWYPELFAVHSTGLANFNDMGETWDTDEYKQRSNLAQERRILQLHRAIALMEFANKLDPKLPRPVSCFTKADLYTY